MTDSIQEPAAQPQAPDLANAIHALRRAAQRAREIAWQTRTPLIVSIDGRLVEYWIEEDPREEGPQSSRGAGTAKFVR